MRTLCLLFIFFLSGCASTYLDQHAVDLKPHQHKEIARYLVDILIQEYPPEHKTIDFKSSGDEFSQVFIDQLRSKGYALDQNKDALQVAYHIDFVMEKTLLVSLKTSEAFRLDSTFHIKDEQFVSNQNVSIRNAQQAIVVRPHHHQSWVLQIMASRNHAKLIESAGYLKTIEEKINIVDAQDKQSKVNPLTLKAIHIGPFYALSEARAKQKEYRAMGYKDAFLIKNKDKNNG